MICPRPGAHDLTAPSRRPGRQCRETEGVPVPLGSTQRGARPGPEATEALHTRHDRFLMETMATVRQPMRIEARLLSLSYGDVVALRDLDADVTGRVIGVLGATASGKTSLLQIIAGLRAPSGGELRINGERVQVGKKQGVSYVPQDTGAFPFFQRPRETMALGLSLRGMPASDYPEQFLQALDLGEEDRSAAGYSAGMTQKVRIAYET